MYAIRSYYGEAVERDLIKADLGFQYLGCHTAELILRPSCVLYGRKARDGFRQP